VLRRDRAGAKGGGERIKGEGERQNSLQFFTACFTLRDMALIKCHECGGQISDHARTCPKCGAPVIATIKRRRKAGLIDWGIRLAVAAVIVITLWIMLHRLKKQILAPLKAIEQKQQSH
jgi:predicted nucleic acid-binding Zn ribbon protein